MAEREWATVVDNSRIGEAKRSRANASDDSTDEGVWNINPGPIRATELYLGMNVELTVKRLLIGGGSWTAEGRVFEVSGRGVVLTRARRDDEEKRWTEIFFIPLRYFEHGHVRLERVWE